MVVRKKVTSVTFGLYTDDDVRARSVVEITSPQTFLSDDGTTPLPGGLYDPKMGPFQTHDSMPCATCAGRFLTCGGHFGHIELCVPLYQPLLMAELLRMLGMKCFCCHRLRSPKRALLVAHAKLLLLHHGRLNEYHELDGQLAQAIRRSLENPHEPSSSAARKTPQAAAAMEAVLNDIIRDLQNTPLPTDAPSTYQQELLRDYTKTLTQTMKAEVKCQHCGAFSPKLKQDQHNKIFQRALAVKQKRMNAADDLKCESALVLLQKRKQRSKQSGSGGEQKNGYDSDNSEDTEVPDQSNVSNFIDDEAMEVDDEDTDSDQESDDDDDDDDDGLASPIKRTRRKKTVTKTTSNHDASTDTTSTTSDQYYMHPGEVRAQCQLTWDYHGELLTTILFGLRSPHAAAPKLSYKTFFVQAIPVPPSRFRPPMTTGGMTVEHGQNQYLTQMINEHAIVRQELFSPEGKERVAHTTWIQLQTSYNCLLDSTKDPSVAAQLGQTPNGIRQLLEKKEGIFRKHMMGKRVDSACRSVISPDPYVGTNEIGIPLAFAQVLTYPTPVTEFNMTELRRLVERGPANYPGARWVEVKNQRIDLAKMSDVRRKAVGAMLLKESSRAGTKPAIVGRQLRHGDTMLVNRQVR